MVCDIACKANADAGGFPDHWLFHNRWANKAKGVKMPNGEGGDGAWMAERWNGAQPFLTYLCPSRLNRMPHAGAAIVFETIGGRTTAIVPSVQRARGGGGGGGKQKQKGKAEAVAADKEEDDVKSAATPATTSGERKRKASAASATASATAMMVLEEKEKKARNSKRGKTVGGGGDDVEARQPKPVAVVKKRGRRGKRA